MKLEARKIEKSYSSRKVVKGVDLELKQGEIVGLLGPNGAGKTTCFYMIVGLIKCDNGVISINNNDISLEPMYKRAKQGIGYLAQEASVFRNLASPPTPAIDIFKDFLTPSVGFKKLSVSLEKIE